MIDYIIWLVIVGMLVFCIKKSASHFKGEGGCCNGGDEHVANKVLDSILYSKKVKIQGMTCSNCAARIKKGLNKLKGVSASVSFSHQEAIVDFNKDIDDEIIKKVIEKLGYQVLSIEKM